MKELLTSTGKSTQEFTKFTFYVKNKYYDAIKGPYTDIDDALMEYLILNSDDWYIDIERD